MRRQSVNFKMIFKVIGFLMILEGLSMLTALPFSWFFHPEGLTDLHIFKATSDFYPILISSLITILFGLILAIYTRTAKRNTTLKK